MARGRRSTGAVTAAALKNTSNEAFVNSSGTTPRSTRSTRSSSTGGATNVKSEPGSDSSSGPIVRRPRGRPTRASMLSTSETASNTAGPAEVPTLSAASSRRQSAGNSFIGSESVSSVPVQGDSSEDEYSTPATSNVPTPAALDTATTDHIKKSRTSIEIRLPGRRSTQAPSRPTRSNMYALNTSKRTEIGASDEEDEDFSDTSLGAQAARRLQEEEYSKAAGRGQVATSLTRSRRSRYLSPSKSSSSTPITLPKRGRSSTLPSAKDGPPSKRSRVIPDSDEIDMDEEIATAAGFDEDGIMDQLVDVKNEDDEDVKGKNIVTVKSEASDSNADSEAEDWSSDEPLMKARGKPRAQATKEVFTKRRNTEQPSTKTSTLALFDELGSDDDAGSESNFDGSDSELSAIESGLSTASLSDAEPVQTAAMARIGRQRRAFRAPKSKNREQRERDRLEKHHPELMSMWTTLENMPILKAGKALQPQNITRQLKPFQLEGLAWLTAMEKTEWKGGLLGDEMGLGKTIQAVSLIMSDYPAKNPSLVLVPPVALMQWQSEIKSYTDGTLKTFVFHGTNQKTKGMSLKDLKKYDVIMMSYNSLESMYRKQEKGFKRKDGIYQEKSLVHSIHFHRVILDEAHCIKTRTTMTAKACFALKTDYRWCLSGTPLQNRIGEFFSLIRFLNISPFASYLCKQCPCSTLEWSMNADNRCSHCNHAGMQHVSVFNQELLNPIQKFGNLGPGREAFRKLRLMTDRMMLRRLKKDHTNAMELPVKEIYIDRQFFGEEENDFANSIMTSGQRKFDTYVAQGVMLNNYANIFGLIMQMRQVADHPDLILKKNAEGGQNVLVCCICDEAAEDAVRSRCKHDFCRTCVASYVRSTDEPDCPRCHVPLVIDLEQPEIEQDETLVKKSSIINRIKMENWTSSSKIELLVHELHKLRSDNATHKSIIFSQFTTMLQLIEWRLRRAGITTVMLDGSMTPAQRQASIEHFMSNVDTECFLVSLKAGGVALNLTEASRVFIVDPWWNPAAEWQSADRCHRIGQTRPCTITRLCIEDSVESRMVALQSKKESMINSTINSDDKAMESLTPEDLQFLFRGS